MQWLNQLVQYASVLLSGTGDKDQGGEKAVEGRGRFAPGCVYRGGAGNCPPFSVNDTQHLPVTYPGDSRPCYDINLKVETYYEFVPVTTPTTQTSISTSLDTTSFLTIQTILTITDISTEFAPSIVTTLTSITNFSPVTVTFVSTITAVGTTTTLSSVITGSVNVGTSVTTIYPTSVPFFTFTDFSFVETIFETTVTETQLSTFITSFATDAFAAAITIGPELKDWSYFHNACANLTYDGDGTFVGGPILSTNSSGEFPLFISSNKKFRLYPCETAEISANFTLSFTGAQNITSPLGYESDPSYGSGLFGAFDLDTGFSFYLIATANRAYAMYSRVPSWCPCVNVTVTAKPCGACRGLDQADDSRYPVPAPVCDPCGDSCPIYGDCNPCGCGYIGACASNLYTMSTQTFPITITSSSTSSSSSPITTSDTTTTRTTTDSTTTTGTTSAAGKANNPIQLPRRELLEKSLLTPKGGFEYFSFTYLVPIDYLVPGAPIKASILLNKGEPSVTWTVNGKPRLTIKNIGQRIDPRFMLATYGGSADYLDFPSSIQLALGLLSVTESTEGRTACQGGVYEECYQGGQSIQDARYTFCNRAAIQDPSTYNLTLAMDIAKLGLVRITKVPRPCCPNYA